ncbi:hypothetical protein GCM10010510_33540 [Streptomyces anandii JCM 4720]|nr:hypothetical protein GCM10010510_33540 [Streptomyces anandii JCM 4720]
MMEAGLVVESGFAAMSRKVLNRGSYFSFGDFRAASVEGTLWMSLAKPTTASVSVVMYLTNSQAAFCLWLVAAMPAMVPVM